MESDGLSLAVPLIAKFEGLRLQPYKDSAGIPTIGYGTTWYPTGVKVTMSDQSITKEQAESYLRYALGVTEKALDRLVGASLNANQHAALLSFVYNIGVAAFGASTLLKKLNRGDYQGAAEEFMRWDHAGGVEIEGLKKRRKAEAMLFTTPVSG